MSEFFNWAWIGWILLFCLLEGFAFYKHGPGYTLSEHVWKWFAIKDANARHNNDIRNPQPITWVVRGRRFLLLAFLAWLVAHFLTGGRF